MNNKFKTLGKKKFLLQGALLCLLSDIGNILYVNMYWFPKKLSIQFLSKMLSLQGVNAYQMPRADLLAYRELLIDAFGIMFFVFLIYHLLVYFLFYKNKLWAKKYVYGYALTGAILTMLELPSLFQDHFTWGVIMLLTTLIYIFTFMGIKYFKKIEER